MLIFVFVLRFLLKHLWAKYVNTWLHRIKDEEVEDKLTEQRCRQERLEILEKALVDGDWAEVDAIR